MSKEDFIEANQVLGRLETDSQEFPRKKTFIHLFKTVFVVIFILALLFSALVVPYFRQSIVTTVMNWLSPPG
jgi:hypothetical protein